MVHHIRNKPLNINTPLTWQEAINLLRVVENVFRKHYVHLRKTSRSVMVSGRETNTVNWSIFVFKNWNNFVVLGSISQLAETIDELHWVDQLYFTLPERKRVYLFRSIAMFTVYKHSFRYSNVPTIHCNKRTLFLAVNKPPVVTLTSISDVTAELHRY